MVHCNKSTQSFKFKAKGGKKLRNHDPIISLNALQLFYFNSNPSLNTIVIKFQYFSSLVRSGLSSFFGQKTFGLDCSESAKREKKTKMADEKDATSVPLSQSVDEEDPENPVKSSPNSSNSSTRKVVVCFNFAYLFHRFYLFLL